MKRSCYSNEQIAYALKQADGGTAMADVWRRLGISEATFTSGRRSTPTSAARRCASRQLRDENSRLKRLVADLTFDKHIMAEISRVLDFILWKTGGKRLHRVVQRQTER